MTINLSTKNFARSLNPTPFNLGLDLTDSGARPNVFREVGSQAALAFDPRNLLRLVQSAEKEGVDFALIDDTFALSPAPHSPGRLDAALVLGKLAPRVRNIGLIPTISAASYGVKEINQLVTNIDQGSTQNGGWQVGSSYIGQSNEKRKLVAVSGQNEAWKSASQTLNQLKTQNALGNAITIIPDAPYAREVALRFADVIKIQAHSLDEAIEKRVHIQSQLNEYGRQVDQVKILTEIHVALAVNELSAQTRLELLAELAGQSSEKESFTFAGTSNGLITLLNQWNAAGSGHGFVLKPVSLGTDFDALISQVIPTLKVQGGLRTGAVNAPLRNKLGLATATKKPALRVASA